VDLLDLENLDRIEDELDYDFSVSEVVIDDLEKFRKRLYDPFRDKERMIFYRGERINSLRRPLLPTLFRDKSILIEEGDFYADITPDYLLDFYKSYGEYYNLFCSTFGHADKHHLYDLCAFSQHYINCSPFLDFTKSLYVALSFGLKGRHEFEDDGIIYAVEIKDPANYTRDLTTAEQWLDDYHVRIYNYRSGGDKKFDLERTSPEAKLIDISSNDRMKFQQGVFLLLDKFNIVNRLYLTKKVRSSVHIKKYILKKELCPALTDLVEAEAPWYSFANLLDISAGIRTAIDYKRKDL
jgi:hypothetical protein